MDDSGDQSSWIVDDLHRVLRCLQNYLCMWPYLFSVWAPAKERPKAGGTEGAAAFTLGASILSLAALVLDVPVWGLTGLVEAMSAYQVLGIVVCQVNTLLFDARESIKYGGSGKVHSYTRSLLLLGANYTEIIFWFATQYQILESQFDHTLAPGFWPLQVSWSVMTSFSDPMATPLCASAARLMWLQSIVGFAMLVIAAAMVVQQMPRRGTHDTLEQRIDSR